jgi:hypothetical protein
LSNTPTERLPLLPALDNPAARFKLTPIGRAHSGKVKTFLMFASAVTLAEPSKEKVRKGAKTGTRLDAAGCLLCRFFQRA